MILWYTYVTCRDVILRCNEQIPGFRLLTDGITDVFEFGLGTVEETRDCMCRAFESARELAYVFATLSYLLLRT